MKADEFGEMLVRLAEGWTAHEYEKVAEDFAEKLFYSDALNYTFRDRRSLLKFFKDDDGKPQSCAFHDWIFDENRQVGVAEYSYSGTYVYHGTVWVELTDDSIISWREYQHRSEKNWETFWNR